jgi:hypothetical protein
MKPIIFSTPMVQAILDGKKTQTRRVVKINGCPITSPKESLELTKEGLIYHSFCSMSGYYKPLCQPGDILWVRETWSRDESGEYVYRTNYGTTEDDSFPPSMFKWRPSIFMPREAARIFLKVTNVRVERLQDISEEDAMAEGCITFHDKTGDGKFEDVLEFDLTARDAFCELWQRLNLKRGYGWETNPWVWVYEFEKISKEEVERLEGSEWPGHRNQD